MKTTVADVIKRISPGILGRIELLNHGNMTEPKFSASVERLIQHAHRRLVREGMAGCHAALMVHSAVLVISRPGLAADAKFHGMPLEVIENVAVRQAARDVADFYRITVNEAADAIAAFVASQ